MNQTTLFGIVVVPAVVGLTQVAKNAGVPSQYAPIVAIALGVLAGIAQLEATSLPWIPAVVAGVGLGLSAVGLYATGQTIATRVGAGSAVPAPAALTPAAAGQNNTTTTAGFDIQNPPPPNTQPQFTTNAAGAMQPPKIGPS